MDTIQIDLINIIQQDTRLKKTASTNGGEWAGPCPFCGGNDRFRVWPRPASGKPRYWCRQCETSGDAISYIMQRDAVGFREACQRLNLEPGSFQERPAAQPRRRDRAIVSQRKEYAALDNAAWQTKADDFSLVCWSAFWKEKSGEVSPGRAYMQERGFQFGTLGAFQVGYNPQPYRGTWGGVDVWLPAGVVIPHEYDRKLWAINVRRLDGGTPKYLKAKGSANSLFITSNIGEQSIVVLVEGELDAMTIWQECHYGKRGPHVVPVATGSTHGGFLREWVVRLGVARSIVLAFDADEAGDKAAARWQQAFPEAKRLKPTRHDVNDMLRAGDDIGQWLGRMVAA